MKPHATRASRQALRGVPHPSGGVEHRRRLFVASGSAAALGALCGGAGASPAPQQSAAVQAIARDAALVRGLVKSPLALEFLRMANALQAELPRSVYARRPGMTAGGGAAHLTAAQFAALAESERAQYEEKLRDEAFYFSTFYGTPVAYARALDVAAEHMTAPATASVTAKGLKLLDIGYGAIGAPRMLAHAGANVSAVDVDPLLPALYAKASVGSVTLYDGVFAGDAALTQRIGGGFGLILAKNTFKRGFMRPRPSKKALVSFGVSDAVLLAALHAALAPNGLFLIYNIAGAFDANRPATDGGSPFSREQFAAAKLELIAFEQDDDSAIRAFGKALGWDTQMGDLSVNLFAQYTLVRRAG
jgi:hypothetical protein